MNQEFAQSVRNFLRRAESTRLCPTYPHEFFSVLGMEVEDVNPEHVGRPFFIVSQGEEGTVVPPIRTALGYAVATKVLPRYFDERNRSFSEPVRGWEVVKLPRLVRRNGRWIVIEKGLLDGAVFQSA